MPYGLSLAALGWEKAVAQSMPLRLGLNVAKGDITYKAVAEAHNLPYRELG